MRVLAILAALPALLIPTVPAFSQSEAASCAAIADNTERLACYDGVFRDGAAGDTEAVVLQSQTLIPAVPSGRGNATMTIACEAGELVVRFGFAGNVLSATGSNTGISLQRDLQRAQAMILPPDPTGTDLVIAGNQAVVDFLNSLRGVTNLGARVTPASSRSLHVRFQVTGLPEQVAPVIAACQ
ncbi:hypothetical protein [Devosia nitrariae]|uniref:Type VI secretion system protein VasI n=1 Tax=Devosia nitrariae TaxID=2071872 RepID=A0ABQ5W4L3_9HYPH|nr:hypothetical protein [Devosia nitrariae]GLQ54912.1 hypothetical protein GCM10010862_21710 [Devosia nitrariae]